MPTSGSSWTTAYATHCSSRSTALSGNARLRRNSRPKSTSQDNTSSATATRRSATSASRWARSTRRVISADISCTAIGANRRSRARSDSMNRRYSSSVVAPMQAMSPLARAGFSSAPTSEDPGIPPAPMMECTSSMNRTRPGWLASASTFCQRCWSSPTTPAPATRFDGWSAMIRRPRRAGGTAPATICWARPSTMAVFPTPAGPIRAGLRFFRRQRMRMHASILAVAADDRGELPFQGLPGEVRPVVLQGRRGAGGRRTPRGVRRTLRDRRGRRAASDRSRSAHRVPRGGEDGADQVPLAGLLLAGFGGRPRHLPEHRLPVQRFADLPLGEPRAKGRGHGPGIHPLDARLRHRTESFEDRQQPVIHAERGVSGSLLLLESRVGQPGGPRAQPDRNCICGTHGPSDRSPIQR